MPERVDLVNTSPTIIDSMLTIIDTVV